MEICESYDGPHRTDIQHTCMVQGQHYHRPGAYESFIRLDEEENQSPTLEVDMEWCSKLADLLNPVTGAQPRREPAHNYGKHAGGRPREGQVPASLGICPIHGEVEFRSHKVGKDRQGNQRWRRRCPMCHAERQGKK